MEIIDFTKLEIVNINDSKDILKPEQWANQIRLNLIERNAKFCF